MDPSPSPSSTESSAVDHSTIFLGVPWDGDALAAVIAGGLALLTLAWTVVSYFLTRSRLKSVEQKTVENQEEANRIQGEAVDSQRASTAREQHHREVTTAIDYVLGPTRASQMIGITLLNQLRVSPNTSDDDRLHVAAVLDAIARS